MSKFNENADKRAKMRAILEQRRPLMTPKLTLVKMAGHAGSAEKHNRQRNGLMAGPLARRRRKGRAS